MAKRKVWMYWKCLTCGSGPFRGDLKHCPNCGAACTGSWYLPEDRELVDADSLKDLGKGPNWICGSCESMNGAVAAHCTNCGAAKGAGSEFDRVDLGYTLPGGGDIQADHTLHPVSSAPTREQTAQQVGYFTAAHDEPGGSGSKVFSTVLREQRRRSRNWRPIVILLAIALVIIGLVYLATRTHETRASISSFSWSRTISIQKYDWVNRDNLTGCPAGSRNCDTRWEQVGSHQEFSHYKVYDTESCRQVPDGQTCRERCTSNGDGTADCEDICTTDYREECTTTTHRDPVYVTVPDYGNRYYYQIQEWIYSRSVTTGAADRDPFWGDPMLGSIGLPEQEAGRSERYLVHYTTIEEEPRPIDRELAYSEWVEYDGRREYILTFNSFGVLLDVQPAPPR